MKALIRKEAIVLNTYPYSDPSPVPEFGRMYPYNRWDGYASQGAPVSWEMVVMENPHIKIWVNAAVGGKVWGAVDKATGREFIYFNHAVKFRDVAMRGPWTSGGIEFNVGILGHSLSCAAPVDCHTRENGDGSVSCFIGAMDWPSRTRWYVEICLPGDAAWFRTRTCWYNGSGVDQAYYSWSNAGIKASGGLSYIFPGDVWLGHDGSAHAWPLDESGRDLSRYENNDTGHYKSYHVIGSTSRFWGCYWERDDFGMAHFSAYDEKPGKKIWIWGLSRYGMIWEDLLTDGDGQYTEVQSGRLFNQSISASSATPFKHRSFLPCSFDTWDEYWMPVAGTGGLRYACPDLSFNISGSVLHICAHQPLMHLLKVEDDNGLLVKTGLSLQTMERLRVSLPAVPDEGSLKVWLGDELIYDAREERHRLQRPVEIAAGYAYDPAEGLYLQAKEWERQRFFARALEKYEACLSLYPYHIRALAGMAVLRLRSMDYEESLSYLRRALSIDTYDGEVNYLYGLVHVRLSNLYDAKDGFSIASQAPAYRSAAMMELGKLLIRQRQYGRALTYIEEAIACNVGNCTAYHLQVVVLRRWGRNEEAREVARMRLLSDPLDHLLRYEAGLGEDLYIHSEWPHETFIEMAAFYTDIGDLEAAVEVLRLSPGHPMVELWKAWVFFQKEGKVDPDLPDKAGRMSPENVFPHRHEDLMVLRWALVHASCWQVKYFLALGLIQLMKEQEALALLDDCGDEPGWYPFYLVRAKLRRDAGPDLLRAVALAPDAWRAGLSLSGYYAEREQWKAAVQVAEKSYLNHTGNYYLGLQLAGYYMHNGQYGEGIQLMKALNVLPNEGASEGRNVWRETHLHAAIAAIVRGEHERAGAYIRAAREWPENMGVGKPYDVDERLEDYLEYCLGWTGEEVVKEGIASFREKYPSWPVGSGDLLTLLVLREQGKMEAFERGRRAWLWREDERLQIRWCNAFLDGDGELLEEMASEKMSLPVILSYELPYEDRAFELIRKMYQTGVLNINE